MKKILKKIPLQPIRYKEGTTDYFDVSDNLKYEPRKGEIVDVTQWVRWPDYDYIFGVPNKSNPKHKKELIFFQFRDTRGKKVQMGFYLDLIEAHRLIQGLQKSVEISKTNSKHLWKHQTK